MPRPDIVIEAPELRLDPERVTESVNWAEAEGRNRHRASWRRP